MRKNVTLMVLMVSSVTGMTSRSHLRCFLCATVEGIECLMTQGPRLCGNDWVFQQINAILHNACRRRDFFQENKITLLDYTVCSPDLNPTENLWGWMTREV
uniref:Secreted protein n=1 Tax=Haplochromis burtoni TaxID=8153 RepID=A0A3Q3C6F3_HAPBU